MSVDVDTLTPPDAPEDLDAWLLGVEDMLAEIMAVFMRTEVPAAVEAYARSLTAAGDTAPFDVLERQWATLVTNEVGDVIGGIHNGGALSAWVQMPTGRRPGPSFGEQWANVVNLEAVEYQRTATNRIVGASSQLWNDVRRKTTAAVKTGMDNEDLTRAVKAITGYSEFRANTIARTETVAAYNGGNYTGAQALGAHGPAEKWWLAAEDARTRPSHNEADGQVVKFDQPFIVGGVPMSRPHDPSAPARETVNCRCVMNLLYEGDTRPDGSTVTARHQPIDQEPEGPVISDEEIGSFIRQELDRDPNASAAELLRRWKALGRPANDVRFRNIYRDVKAGGSGVRTADKIGKAGRTSRATKPAPTVDRESANRFKDERARAKRGVQDYVTHRAAEQVDGLNEFAQITTFRDHSGRDRVGRAISELGRGVNEDLAKVGRAVDDEIHRRVGIRHSDLNDYHRRYLDAQAHEDRAFNVSDREVRRQARMDAERELNEARSLYRSEALKLLEEERPGYGSRQVKTTGFREGGTAVREAGRYYPAEWVEAMPEYRVKHVARGYHHAFHSEIGISDESLWNQAMSTSQYDRVAVHELGHASEEAVPLVKFAEELYNAERTGVGTVSRWANSRPPTWTRTANEWGFKDEWYDDYVGRDYSGRNFEIMSMGMEQMFGGQRWSRFSGYKPMDDDYAHWLLGVLMSL